jgi:hypothetical protein
MENTNIFNSLHLLIECLRLTNPDSSNLADDIKARINEMEKTNHLSNKAIEFLIKLSETLINFLLLKNYLEGTNLYTLLPIIPKILASQFKEPNEEEAIMLIETLEYLLELIKSHETITNSQNDISEASDDLDIEEYKENLTQLTEVFNIVDKLNVQTFEDFNDAIDSFIKEE